MSDRKSENGAVKLSLPLPYQQEIFHQIREFDGLLILAKGLGLLRIVANLLHAYDVAGNNLILIVGANERENGWIGEAMAEHATLSCASGSHNSSSNSTQTPRGLSIMNNDVTDVKMRKDLYARGGIFSVTSRILAVDYLSPETLDLTKVTGMIVLHAERVLETSSEAFILQIYREKNTHGFLKAFSDTPIPFSVGFAPLEKHLKHLHLQKTFLYPRFQVTVASSLEGKRKAEVIELEIHMTESMHTIQIAIIECIEVSISELKKANPGLDVEGWNIDAALHRNFDDIVRRQLKPVWHRTSFRTRQMVRDLTLLRNMLNVLLTSDCVTFNQYLDTIRAAAAPPPGSTRYNHPPWILLDAAETIFSLGKSRVYTGYLSAEGPIDGQADVSLVLEEQPKWALLAEIMHEIDQHLLTTQSSGIASSTNNKTVLIMCGEQSTCAQVKEYLQTMNIEAKIRSHDVDSAEEETDKQSGQIFLKRKLHKYRAWKRDFPKFSASILADNTKVRQQHLQHQYQNPTHNGSNRPPPPKRRRVRGGSSVAATDSGRRTPNTVATDQSGASSSGIAIPGDQEAHMVRILEELKQGQIDQAINALVTEDTTVQVHELEDNFELFDMDDLVLVHPYDGDMDEHMLEETKPTYIIMYEPNTDFIRRVEAYRSSHKNTNLRVYFMYYTQSVEEQKYLSTVRTEKDSFTKVIGEYGSLGISINQSSLKPSLGDAFLRSLSTRIAGGGLTQSAASQQASRIIVDVREFRSSLPSFIHRRGIQVVPATLTVGDYILSPNLCVERKSVRDLIGSLNNGRIYHQAETMLRHYRYAILLIEFDRSKAFTFEMFADLSLGPNAGSGAVNTASHTRSGLVADGSGSSNGHGGSGNINDSDLQTKLVLLTIAFPGLRIVWTSSPNQSAELFEEMKRLEKEPEKAKAVSIGMEEIGADEDQNGSGGTLGVGRSIFSQIPTEMLMAIPGVGFSAAKKIQLALSDIVELANMDEELLEKIVGADVAKQITMFFERKAIDG